MLAAAELGGDVPGAVGEPDALERLLLQVEVEVGAGLEELSREEKQKAVKILEERGAFNLRGSVEDVADRLGVSRFTVYNYLNATS
ncbi:MAG: helix-turn-helix domain-containing protein [Actinomycetes bacterium]